LGYLPVVFPILEYGLINSFAHTVIYGDLAGVVSLKILQQSLILMTV
jgi:hypothetical protein